MTMSIAAASPVSAESLQAQLAACVRITGLLQRLACDDGVVKDAGITAPAAARPAPASPYTSVPAPVMTAPALASAPPAPVPSTPSSFGAESLPRTRLPAAGSAKAINAGVAALSFDGTGH